MVVTGGTVNSYRYEEPGRRGNPPTDRSDRSDQGSLTRTQQRETGRSNQISDDEDAISPRKPPRRYNEKQVLTCLTCITYSTC